MIRSKTLPSRTHQTPMSLPPSPMSVKRVANPTFLENSPSLATDIRYPFPVRDPSKKSIAAGHPYRIYSHHYEKRPKFGKKFPVMFPENLAKLYGLEQASFEAIQSYAVPGQYPLSAFTIPGLSCDLRPTFAPPKMIEKPARDAVFTYATFDNTTGDLILGPCIFHKRGKSKYLWAHCPLKNFRLRQLQQRDREIGIPGPIFLHRIPEESKRCLRRRSSRQIIDLIHSDEEDGGDDVGEVVKADRSGSVENPFTAAPTTPLPHGANKRRLSPYNTPLAMMRATPFSLSDESRFSSPTSTPSKGCLGGARFVSESANFPRSVSSMSDDENERRVQSMTSNRNKKHKADNTSPSYPRAASVKGKGKRNRTVRSGSPDSIPTPPRGAFEVTRSEQEENEPTNTDDEALEECQVPRLLHFANCNVKLFVAKDDREMDAPWTDGGKQ